MREINAFLDSGSLLRSVRNDRGEFFSSLLEPAASLVLPMRLYVCCREKGGHPIGEYTPY
jgi:hypothetical protein